MLTRLYISNVVLIDKLELDFSNGLNIMTGETGAGKSILLDALALALGSKTDTGLIRAGADSATVIAEFDNETLLKRTLSPDGKSRCWINDEPVTIKALKDLGDQLIEIHGQFASNSLLDSKTHCDSLDSFGKYAELKNEVRTAYEQLHESEKKLKELRNLVEKSENERDFLRHNISELETLAPKIGEESELAEMRQKMMDAEKNSGILKEACAIIDQGGLAEKIFSAAHILERTKSYKTQIDKLYEAGSTLQEISEQIAPTDFEVSTLESAEERLFALRAAARKHKVTVDELRAKLEDMQSQLNTIDNSDAEIRNLEKETSALREKYTKLANVLTTERTAAANKLRAAVKDELPSLKLGTADFMVNLTATDLPTANGNDIVQFVIKTNPGMPFAALDKIASGGELARFMLALRVVLMTESRSLIFDEIDTGISGATAAAVGERLAKLASGGQVIVITHSAQVAGFGNSHFKIIKTTDGKTTTTSVEKITGEARVNEIARIISGAHITPDSIAAAKTLLGH